eukprot:SAG31_NODE_761_length_12276_cov_4.530673_18_plen_94_part_00
MVIDTRPPPHDGSYAKTVVEGGQDLLELENRLIMAGTRNAWSTTMLAHMHLVLGAQRAESLGPSRKPGEKNKGFSQDGSDSSDLGDRPLTILL